MPIQLLDRDVASKIAAGEVIERPASVVKELVENAIDAGAGQIEVEIARGGLDLIRVTDDAAGIPEDELELAVTRHATSKLRSVQDLSRIGTLGFRGEALASIGAVARMTLVSRVQDTEGGNYVIVDNNEIIERGRQGAPFGTTAFVRDLFKSVPARLSFLRSPAAEATRCVTVLTQYALAHPDVALRVLVDGRLAFHSPGSGDASHVLPRDVGPGHRLRHAPNSTHHHGRHDSLRLRERTRHHASPPRRPNPLRQRTTRRSPHPLLRHRRRLPRHHPAWPLSPRRPVRHRPAR